jgi:hypothetical protein
MALFKAVSMSTKIEGLEVTSKQYCTSCKKFGHDDAYCFNNLDNPNNQLPKTKAKDMVAVDEASTHSIGGNIGKQQVRRAYPRPTGCHIC